MTVFLYFWYMMILSDTDVNSILQPIEIIKKTPKNLNIRSEAM